MLLELTGFKSKLPLLLFSILVFFMISFGQNELIPNDCNKFYYENGNISSERMTSDGQPDGYWKTYYENSVTTRGCISDCFTER